MVEEIKPSPAYTLLAHVWQHANKSSLFSWERLNRSMHSALILAIDSGMKFDKDDFTKTSKDFRIAFWVGDGEGIYTQAVKSGNISACQSMETWLNRKPFIAKFPTDLSTYGVGHSAHRKESRIAVGTQFMWDSKHVTVTSFSKDNESLTACTYKPYSESNERKIEKRYHITLKELNKGVNK